MSNNEINKFAIHTDPKPDQPFLQGSDHLTAIYEANLNVENKPSVLEIVPTLIEALTSIL